MVAWYCQWHSLGDLYYQRLALECVEERLLREQDVTTGGHLPKVCVTLNSFGLAQTKRGVEVQLTSPDTKFLWLKIDRGIGQEQLSKIVKQVQLRNSAWQQRINVDERRVQQ